MSILIYRKVTKPVPVTKLPVSLLHMAQIYLIVKFLTCVRDYLHCIRIS